MANAPHRPETVVRTSRGLSVAGTRITLYALLDYLYADWPPKLIQDWFNLTDQQMADILAYLAAHRDEVEAEYQQVLREAHANRQYWEAHNCARRAHQTPTPGSPEQEALRAKLQVWKAQLRQP